jgi:hypothetical protein
MRNIFRREKIEDRLSIGGLFPELKSRAKKGMKVCFGIGELIVSAILGGIWGITAGIIGTVAGVIIDVALAVGLSAAVSAIMGKKPSGGTVTNNGRVFNTRVTSQPVTVLYGNTKVGGNWLYADPSGSENKRFNMAISWGEGEIGGVAKAISEKADYYGGGFEDQGLNDMIVGGIYTGATHSLYLVQIDAIGNPDTFKWSNDYGATWEAATVAITGLWQTLDDGVKIKFKNTTGHTVGNFWYFTAGDGYWLGDKLISFYEHYNNTPLLIANNSQIAWQVLHTGTTYQTVDSYLANLEPIWADALRNTAYSVFSLEWNDYAWQGLPEFRITVKGLKVHDTRVANFPNDTPVYSRNPALCWYDLMTNKRYGLGIDTSRIDADSVSDAATWCDTNTYYLDTALTDSMAFGDHIEDMLLNFRGFVTRSNGIYKLRVYSDDAAVMFLGDDDFDIETGVTINVPGIPELPNKVKCTFINAEKCYKSDFASYEEDAILLADGVERVIDISLTGTSGFLQAKKLAKYHYFRARHGTTYTMLGRPRCFNLEPGDMVNITNEFLGWTAKKVRVSLIGLPQEGMVPITFIEENSEIYDQTVNIDIEDTWLISAGGISIDSPTNLTVVGTGPDEETWNKSDAYVDLEWDNPADGTEFILIYKKTVGSTSWTYINLSNNIGPTILYRIGGLPDNTTYDWGVRQKRGTLVSAWTWGTDFTTYTPDIPTMGDVFLSASSETSAVVLTWIKAGSDYNIFEWLIYRNTTNNSATATLIDRKSRITRTYRDLFVNTGTTYYYWLKATDRWENESTSFSNVAWLLFLHWVMGPIFKTVAVGDVPANVGTNAFIADTILLDACDDYTDFQDDATDPDDIIIEQEVTSIKEGTGALKITAHPYYSKLSYEGGSGLYTLGLIADFYGRRYISQGFKCLANYTCAAIGLKVHKVGTPAHALSVEIYSDVGGVPDAWVAGTTIAVADVPSTLGEDPYTYAILAKNLTNGTTYHIVLDAGGYDTSNYYKVYGNFVDFGVVNAFGGAGEMFHTSTNKTTWVDYETDTSDCWDMNFRICEVSTALNKYVWSTIGAVDISAKTYLKFWAKSNRVGTNFQIGFGEALVSEQLFNVAITATNTWEFQTIDISAVPVASRNAVTKVGIKLTNLDSPTIIHLDHIFTNVDEPIPKIYIGGAWRAYILDNNTHFGHAISTTVYKTADESVTSSTILQNDDHLFKAMAISEVWGVRLVLMGNNSAVGLFKMKFTIPANGAFYWIDKTEGVSNTSATELGDIDFTAGRGIFTYEGIYVGGDTAGNLQLQWAQSASSATPTKLLIGSYLFATKLSA